MEWYHDLGNDRWICDLFGGMRGGYFIEAGALDGVAASATYSLERFFGWTGICVEPNSALFPWLVAHRNCICEMRCLADDAGEVDYIEVREGAIGYSGIVQNLADFKREFWSTGITTRKAAVSLAQMLREHNAPRTIDYLALDTEGSEARILTGFDFSEFQVRAISIEGDECTGILTAAGYTEVRNPFCNVEWEHYYVRPDLVK